MNGDRIIRWVAVTIGVVALGLVALLALSDDSTDRRADSPLLGRPVPGLTGTTLTGDTYDIDEDRGRWVLVNFFASWCVPCVVEHPELIAFSESRTDVRVVSIPFDDRLSDVEEFFDKRGGDWPVLVDGIEGVALDFAIIAVPESFLVSPNGIVVAKLEGGVSAEGLEELLADVERAP